MKINYNYAFFDEGSKREIRRATLKAIAIPGYQVPFASREMPIARGWGTGGLQLTLSLVGMNDILKVIDQGSDESVNAVNIKRLITVTTGITVSDETAEATIIQSRHRIPEIPLQAGQILVLQVPIPEPLRYYEPSEYETKKLHAEQEYSGAWLMLFEQIMNYGTMSTGADHPVMVHSRYVMAPSPIPRFDNPKLNCSPALILLGAGREKRSMQCLPILGLFPLILRTTLLRQNHFRKSHADCAEPRGYFSMKYWMMLRVKHPINAMIPAIACRH